MACHGTAHAHKSGTQHWRFKFWYSTNPTTRFGCTHSARCQSSWMPSKQKSTSTHRLLCITRYCCHSIFTPWPTTRSKWQTNRYFRSKRTIDRKPIQQNSGSSDPSIYGLYIIYFLPCLFNLHSNQIRFGQRELIGIHLYILIGLLYQSIINIFPFPIFILFCVCLSICLFVSVWVHN